MPDRSPNLGWAPRVALFAALLPVTATKSGAAYTILAGFQLTPDQMTQTRRRTP